MPLQHTKNISSYRAVTHVIIPAKMYIRFCRPRGIILWLRGDALLKS